MTVAPGQRYKMPSGSVWQVIRLCEIDIRNVFCAPVIDGVLRSTAHDIEEFRVSYLTRFGRLVR